VRTKVLAVAYVYGSGSEGLAISRSMMGFFEGLPLMAVVAEDDQRHMFTFD
jgi:hypothetical protein